MMEKEKQLAADYLRQHRQTFLQDAQALLQLPELGFRETATRQYLAERLAQMGFANAARHAITGLKVRTEGRRQLATVCLIGELDAVLCATHPDRNPQTDAAHACGHSLQCAILLAVAQTLTATGLMNRLDGDVVFFAVPAEELIDLDYREALRQSGELHYAGGKQQLLYEDAFADIDMAMMLHAQPHTPEKEVFVEGGSLGFVRKLVDFWGKAAHAAAPADGVNALSAANLALAAINANRDTFREQDSIRVHPILTAGGTIVNSVPEHARLEMYVRAANAEAIRKVSRVVDNCMEGASLAIGTRVEVDTQPGYLPLRQDIRLSRIFEENVRRTAPDAVIRRGVDMIGSTDMGDLSMVLPCIHPSIGGYTGAAHSSGFSAVNLDFCLLDAAQMLLGTILDLLGEGAQQAQAVREQFVPQYTRQQLLDYLEQLRS